MKKVFENHYIVILSESSEGWTWIIDRVKYNKREEVYGYGFFLNDPPVEIQAGSETDKEIKTEFSRL